MRIRVKWTPTKRGWAANTQGGETKVELVNCKNYWRVLVNGNAKSPCPNERTAKRYGRNFL